MTAQPTATSTPIPGLVVFDLPVHADARGWFKENWQREKMSAVGLPDFGPVQNNVSFNTTIGTTRGIHAEPWDKFVSVATGRVFGAWVDLREGPSFGSVYTTELSESRAVFVPRGVGNAYQTLVPDTAYIYLTNAHWSASATYSFVNLADETAAIDWPIPLSRAEISEKDRHHPRLGAVSPVPPRKTLIIGANGQLGRALCAEYGRVPWVECVDRAALDIASPGLGQARRWRDYGTIINAAAYTGVDSAETREGRRDAWAANVSGVAALARIAAAHDITLVHVSSDYVFDGTATAPYTEDAPVSPLGVYAATKAAGEAIVATVPRHYVVRISWLIGDGASFVRTMADRASRGIGSTVVNDQTGRLTFAGEVASGIRHLLRSDAQYGTYNLTGGGPPTTWYEVARDVYRFTGHDPDRVTPASTAEYGALTGSTPAPRPAFSVLDTTKIEATDFTVRDARLSLAAHLGVETATASRASGAV